MKRCFGLLVLVGLLITGNKVSAQVDYTSSPSNGKFSLFSKPSGAFVYLQGDYDFTGVTPCEVPFTLEGKYHVKALKRGFEDWSSQITLMGDRQNSLYIKLSPKTKWKTAMRSAIFPGWGQYYTDRKTKGVIFGLLQIGSLLGTAYAYQNYEEAKDDYYTAIDRYRAEKRIEELPHLRAEMNKLRRDADSAWELRNTFLALTAGVWAYNVLESVLFFPRYGQDLYDGTPATITGSIERDGAKIVIARTF
jgi:hypothetical protein